jgi:protein-S-isoprenylcysteine O-methyltransferase Ste14
MSFGIYLLGYLLLIVGLATGAHMLNVPPQWIGVGALCLIGVAVIHGVTATRQKDPAA